MNNRELKKQFENLDKKSKKIPQLTPPLPNFIMDKMTRKLGIKKILF